MGNDEQVFDSPGLGVPTVSLDRYPFEAYTHYDIMDLVKLDKLEEVVEIMIEVADTLERDYIPKQLNRVPVYLTRFDLYSDWTYQREQYDVTVQMLDLIWSGKSILDIALTVGVDFDIVEKFFDEFLTNGLIEKQKFHPIILGLLGDPISWKEIF